MKTRQREPKPNKNKAPDLDVIHLPEDVVAAAKAIAAAEPEGEASPIISYDEPANENADALAAFNSIDQAREDLLQAAKDPGSALRETYDDIQAVPDPEIVAAVILDAENEAIIDAESTVVKERPVLAALLATPPSRESDFANSSYAVVAGLGEAITGAWNKAGKFCKHLYIRSIFHWNGVVDATKTFGNKCWAEYDKFRKAYAEKPLKIHIWFNAFTAGISAKLAAAKSTYNADLEQSLTDLCETFEKEMRRMSTRMTSLEDEVRRGRKKTNVVVNTLSGRIEQATHVDAEMLNKFAAALLQGRKTGAIDLYRALTGADLTEAKLAIEKAVAA